MKALLLIGGGAVLGYLVGRYACRAAGVAGGLQAAANELAGAGAAAASSAAAAIQDLAGDPGGEGEGECCSG